MRVQSQEHAWGRMQQRVIRGSKGLGNKIDPSRGVDVTSLLSDETLLDILGRLPSNPHPCSLVCKRWLRLQGLLRRSIRVKDWAFLESGSMIARFPHLTDVDLTGASVLPLKSSVAVLFSHHFLSIELSPDAYDPTSIERFIRERQLDLSSLDAGLKALADSCPALQKLAMADVSRAPTFHDRISLWRTESWSHHSSALAETETATKKASCDSTLMADPFRTVVKTDCTIKVRDSTDRASVHVSVETEGGVKARDSVDQASVHVSLETEGSIKACDSFDQASVHVSLETEGNVKACDSVNQAIVHVSLETDGAVKACNPINGAVKKASIDRAPISGALKTEGMVKTDDSNDQACVDVSLETEGAVEACDPNDGEVKKVSADRTPTSVSLKTEGMVKGHDSVDGASVNASLETDGVVKACDSIDGAPVSTALEIEGAVQKTCDSVDRAPVSIAPVTEDYDSINGAFVDTSLEMEGTFKACDSIAGAPVSAVPEIEGVVEKACNSVDEVPVSTTPETDRVIRVHDSINAASINASLEMEGAVEACNSIDRAPVSTVSETDGVVEKACNSVDRTPISTTPETGVEKVHDSINGASVNATLEMEGTLKTCDSVDRAPVSITLETGVVKKACDFVDRAPVTTTPEMEEVVNARNSINEASVNASLEADGAVKACDSIETGRVVKKDCNSIDRAPVSTVIETSGVIKARDSINGAAISAMEETGGVVKACDSNGGAAINASQNTEGTVKACNSIDGAPVSTALGIGSVVKACDSINRATISALEETGSVVKEEKLKLELEVKEEEEERGLAYVAKKCPMLQELKLYQCSDESLGAISGCRNLQIVRLVGSLNGFYRCTFTDVGLTVLARSCRRLVKLGLSGCEASYDGIAAIGKCCPMLEELSLCNQGFYEGWIAALSFCSCLKTLRLEACRQIDPIPGPLEHVGRCAALEHLQLVRCNLKDRPGFTALMLVCSAVRELEFRDCWGLEDEIFSLVCNCPSVRVLSLEGCSLVTTSGLEAVVRTWTKLQTLQVVCCNSIKDSEIGPELATQFILLKELKWRPDAKSQLSVDLAGTGVGQMGGKFFKKGGAG